MARYAGQLLAPADDFGRGFFCPSGEKMAYFEVFAHFRLPWRHMKDVGHTYIYIWVKPPRREKDHFYGDFFWTATDPPKLPALF